jgi:hypothetical protein
MSPHQFAGHFNVHVFTVLRRPQSAVLSTAWEARASFWDFNRSCRHRAFSLLLSQAWEAIRVGLASYVTISKWPLSAACETCEINALNYRLLCS